MARRTANDRATNGLSRLKEEWRDPLLTALTLLLALLMFVLAPLEAVGFTGAQDFGFAIAVFGHWRDRCSVGKSNRYCRAVGRGSILPLRPPYFAFNSLPLSMSLSRRVPGS